jgi:hypothetical protein
MLIDSCAPRASRIALAVSTCCFLLAGNAVAAPFGAFDARSAGMGHVGVAAGTLSNAAFYNPALLAVQRADDDLAFIATAGARVADAENLIDDVDAFQAAYNAGDPDAAQAALTRASGKAMFAQGDGGLALALAGDRNAGAFSVQSHVGAAIAVTDPTPSGTPEDSELNFVGVEIQEVGLSLAHRFDIADGMAIGLTPKYVRVSTYSYSEPLVTASTDPVDLIDSRNQMESDTVNLDAGIVFGHANGWRAGLVGRNLIEKEFAMVNGGTIKLSPQARAGLAYVSGWGTVAADLDLIENEPVSFEGKTQMAAVGVELNAFDLLQVRAGFQRNLAADATEDQDTYSAGVGFSPFGLHVDVAAMTNGNENDLGVYAEVGLRF